MPNKIVLAIAVLGCVITVLPTASRAEEPPKSDPHFTEATKPRSTPEIRRGSSLADLLRHASQGRFATPNADELRAVETLFGETLSGLQNPRYDQVAKLRSAWARWEMKLTQKRWDEQIVFFLSEEPDAQRGRGVYAFCPDKLCEPTAIALQSPHSFFDQHTRAINASLFATGEISAAAWNTTKRSEADLAHTRFHYLNAFTSAFANVFQRGTVVQLHGFAAQKRKTSAASKADLIVSNGTREPNARAQELARLWHDSLTQHSVVLFPMQVTELGGTTNVQGQILHQYPGSHFLHLEMSQRLRKVLRRDASIRDDFLQSLLSGTRR